MSKIMMMCDCSAADKCPQGKVSGMNRCSIIRDERIEATIEIERPAERLQNLVDGAHIRCDVLTERVSNLESRTGRHAMAEGNHKRMDRLEKAIEAMRNALQGTYHEGENVKRRLDDIGKQFGAQQTAINAIVDRLDEAYAEAQRQTERIDNHDTTLGTKDRAIGILSARMDGLVLESAARGGQRDERADNLEKYCEALQARLESIETCCQEGVLGELIRERIVKNRSASINRVIKGGWCNVYCDAAGLYLSRPWFSREGADAQADPKERRIACIRIPDITEGEGL